MRKQDIRVGTEYATAPGDWEFRNFSRVKRVRVINLDAKIVTGWRGNTRPGSEVVIINDDGSDGESIKVPNRLIYEEWESYAKKREARDNMKRLNEQNKRAARFARAADLTDIIPALQNAGIADSTYPAHNGETREAIEYYYPTIFILKEDGSKTTTIKCPLAISVVDYVHSGGHLRIKAEDLMKVIVG